MALTAGIHGDEYEGPKALHDLAKALDPARLAGTVLVVPIAHLAAFEAGTRTSPIDGVNLARVFPGDPEGTITHRLAATLFREVVEGADVLVDLHSGGVRLAFAAVAGFYGDEAATARALALPLALAPARPRRRAVLRGAPARHRGRGLRGGRARRPAGRRTATAYRDGLLRLMRLAGMIEGDPGPEPAWTHVLDGDWQLAPVGGLLDNHVGVGERVAQGRRSPRSAIRSASVLAEMDGTSRRLRHGHAPSLHGPARRMGDLRRPRGALDEPARRAARPGDRCRRWHRRCRRTPLHRGGRQRVLGCDLAGCGRRLRRRRRGGGRAADRRARALRYPGPRGRAHRRLGTVPDVTTEAFDRYIAVNLRGAFLVARAVARRLIAAGRPGRLIMIGSVNSLAAEPEALPYVAAKHGLLGLVRAMAVDLARHRITANLIAPGPDPGRPQPGSCSMPSRCAPASRAPCRPAAPGAPEAVAEAALYFADPTRRSSPAPS